MAVLLTESGSKTEKTSEKSSHFEKTVKNSDLSAFYTFLCFLTEMSESALFSGPILTFCLRTSLLITGPEVSISSGYVTVWGMALLINLCWGCRCLAAWYLLVSFYLLFFSPECRDVYSKRMCDFYGLKSAVTFTAANQQQFLRPICGCFIH